MDSITQLALGGAIGYAVMGRSVGRRAALYGAVLGTLPDLDVLIPYGSAVANFTYHRGITHSFLIHVLATPIFAWLLSRLHPSEKNSFWRWASVVFLIFSTHAIIDALTVYGTQLLWGITEYPFAHAIFFIIDPLYTLPLLIPLLMMFWRGFAAQTLHRATVLGLILSTAYIGWAAGVKVYIDQLNHRVLASANIDSRVYVSTPAPMTTLLWRSVVVDGDHYYEIYTSIFDSVDEVSINQYPTQPKLLEPITDVWEVQRLQWFTKGLFSVREVDGEVILSDLRMGVEGAYVFTFAVGQINDTGAVIEGDHRQIENRPSFAQLPLIFKRITDPSVTL